MVCGVARPMLRSLIYRFNFHDAHLNGVKRGGVAAWRGFCPYAYRPVFLKAKTATRNGVAHCVHARSVGELVGMSALPTRGSEVLADRVVRLVGVFTGECQ